MGVVGDRGVEVEGIGQVELAVDAARPATETSASAMSTCRASAAAGRSASACSGSNRAIASWMSRSSWAGADLVRHMRDVGVHERRRGG